MNDGEKENRGIYQTKADPEIQAREEALWQRVTDDFTDEERHREYLGFCIKNNMMLAASKKYGAYAEDKESYSIDLRRQARQRQQQIANIMFMTPRTDPSLREHRSVFGTLPAVEVVGILLGALIMLFSLFGGLATSDPRLRLFLLLVPLPISLGGLVIYFRYKLQQIKDKMDRD